MKQTLAFDDHHGSPQLLDICHDYLAASTNNKIARVFKVAGREAKPHAGVTGVVVWVCKAQPHAGVMGVVGV